MKTIIFDLDDTLIDTKKIKELIFNKIASYGIDHRIVKQTYEKSKSSLGNYTIDDHLDLLKTEHGFDYKRELNFWFESVDLKETLFSDSFDILEKTSKEHKVILLTKGEESFQNVKIKNSGLEKYFSDVYIIEGEKEDFLKDFDLSGEVIFINDKESENLKIKDLFLDIEILNSIEKLKGVLNK